MSHSETGRLVRFALAAGLIAGVASWSVGEAIMVAYKAELSPKVKPRQSAEDLRRLDSARVTSAAASFAALGGLFGLAMGASGGLARRSISSAGRAGLLGLALGGVGSAAVTAVFVPIYYRNQDPQAGDLLLPLLTHGAIWSVVGASGGLAFGFGLGGRGRWALAALGGMAGAVAATALYEVLGAVAFPLDRTDLPLAATSAARATAPLLVTLLASACAAFGSRQAPDVSDPRG